MGGDSNYFVICQLLLSGFCQSRRHWNAWRIPSWEGIPKPSGFSRFLDQTVSAVQFVSIISIVLHTFKLGITVGWARSMLVNFHWLHFIIFFQIFFESSSLKSVANYGKHQRPYQRWLDKRIYKKEMKFWAVLGSQGCREKNSQLP